MMIWHFNRNHAESRCALHSSLEVHKVQCHAESLLVQHIIPVTNSLTPLFIQHTAGTEIWEGLWNTEWDMNSITTNETGCVYYFFKVYVYFYEYSLNRNNNFCKDEKKGHPGGTHLENVAIYVHLWDTYISADIYTSHHVLASFIESTLCRLLLKRFSQTARNWDPWGNRI